MDILYTQDCTLQVKICCVDKNKTVYLTTLIENTTGHRSCQRLLK